MSQDKNNNGTIHTFERFKKERKPVPEPKIITKTDKNNDNEGGKSKDK